MWEKVLGFKLAAGEREVRDALCGVSGLSVREESEGATENRMQTSRFPDKR